jgi:predicted RNase H-like HicB family nuclease
VGRPPPVDRYEIDVAWSEPDQAFVARVPWIPFAAGYGKTQDGARADLRETIELYIDNVWRLGKPIPLEAFEQGREALAKRISDNPVAFAMQKVIDPRRFDFLFLELQDDPDNLLPVGEDTHDSLVELGIAMGGEVGGDSEISAAYTYFGQFVDHDIMLEAASAEMVNQPTPALAPLPLETIRQQTKNVRTGVLELDSVYNLPAPRDPDNNLKMMLGKVSPSGGRPPGKDDFNDLPRRRPVPDDVAHDRAAMIGDPRNDENLIVSQLHVAFLRAHNRLVDEAAPPNRFQKARRRLRRHYQHIVLHDFLKQIADPVIVDDTIERNRVYDPDEDEFFMPLEFSVAAFRFGHSMVRAEYNYNLNFPQATLEQLFTFTALSGQLGGEGALGFDTLPENWIIQWERFFRGFEGFNKVRKIDTQLVEPLEHLLTMEGEDELGSVAKLAVRTLLRGYQMRMPTGQAVARALRKKLRGVRDMPVLSSQQVRDGAANQRQVEVLENAGFDERTPLWYYILAEAEFLRDGRRLGPVGSTIVAEVLVGLVRRSPDSILAPGEFWEPNLPSVQPGTFTLPDLLRFAGVLTG